MNVHQNTSVGCFLSSILGVKTPLRHWFPISVKQHEEQIGLVAILSFKSEIKSLTDQRGYSKAKDKIYCTFSTELPYRLPRDVKYVFPIGPIIKCSYSAQCNGCWLQRQSSSRLPALDNLRQAFSSVPGA